MIIFISGSVNSGKTTTGRQLADKLGAVFLDFDDFRDRNIELKDDIPNVFGKGITRVNELVGEGKSVVAAYVISEQDHDMLKDKIHDNQIHFITLSPSLEVALSERGGRSLSEWEVSRIKYHYANGVNSPSFGEVIDTSELNLEQTVELITMMVTEKGEHINHAPKS